MYSNEKITNAIIYFKNCRIINTRNYRDDLQPQIGNNVFEFGYVAFGIGLDQYACACMWTKLKITGKATITAYWFALNKNGCNNWPLSKIHFSLLLIITNIMAWMSRIEYRHLEGGGRCCMKRKDNRNQWKHCWEKKANADNQIISSNKRTKSCEFFFCWRIT